jgi:hypothetical protein
MPEDDISCGKFRNSQVCDFGKSRYFPLYWELNNFFLLLVLFVSFLREIRNRRNPLYQYISLFFLFVFHPDYFHVRDFHIFFNNLLN